MNKIELEQLERPVAEATPEECEETRGGFFGAPAYLLYLSMQASAYQDTYETNKAPGGAGPAVNMPDHVK